MPRRFHAVLFVPGVHFLAPRSKRDQVHGLSIRQSNGARADSKGEGIQPQSTKGAFMDWLKYTNAFTGWPVHVRASTIVAIHQDTAGTLIELQGGGRVTVTETVDEVKKSLDKPSARRKDLETR